VLPTRGGAAPGRRSLLPRGPLQGGPQPAASALPSTGVSAGRRTTGQLFYVLGCMQIAVQDSPARLARERAVGECPLLVHPPQPEQVVLAGSHRLARTSRLPYHAA